MAAPSDSARQGTNVGTAAATWNVNVGSPTAGTLLIVFIRTGGASSYRSLVGVTTDYTARYIDRIVRVGTSGGTRTVTLPSAAGWAGIDITVHHYVGSNSLTIDPPGAQTIDGSSTYVVPLGVAVRCVSDGTNWVIMGIGLPGQTQTYAASNVVTDRTYDANATTLDELADVLGTLIADLRARNLVA